MKTIRRFVRRTFVILTLLSVVGGSFSRQSHAFFPEPLILGALLSEGGAVISESFRVSRIRKALPVARAALGEEEAREILQAKLCEQERAVRERARERVIENRKDHNVWVRYIRARNEKKKSSWIDPVIPEKDLPKEVDEAAPISEADLVKQLPRAAGDLRYRELKRLRESGERPPVIAHRELEKARERMQSLYTGDYFSVVDIESMNLVFHQLGSPMLFDERETAASIIYLNEMEQEIARRKAQSKARPGVKAGAAAQGRAAPAIESDCRSERE